MILGGGACKRFLNPSRMGLVPHKRGSREISQPLLPCEDTRCLKPRRGFSPNNANTTTVDFQLPDLGEINFCCLQANQSVVHCYSRLNGLRHIGHAFVLYLKSYHHTQGCLDFSPMLSSRSFKFCVLYLGL